MFRYFWNRVKEQRSLQVGDYKLGSVTVRAQLLRDHVRVEVECLTIVTSMFYLFHFMWRRRIIALRHIKACKAIS